MDDVTGGGAWWFGWRGKQELGLFSCLFEGLIVCCWWSGEDVDVHIVYLQEAEDPGGDGVEKKWYVLVQVRKWIGESIADGGGGEHDGK